MKDIDSDYMHVSDEFNDKVKEKAQIVYDKMNLLASYEKKLSFLKESDSIIKELNNIIKARMAEMANACE